MKVRGTFTSQGRFVSIEGTLDTNGFYRIENLDSQVLVTPIQIQVSAWQDTLYRHVQNEVTLHPGQTEVLLDLELAPTHSIQGLAVGPDGEGLEGVVIRLGNGFGHMEAQTSGDGWFSLEASNGKYRLSARREGYAPLEDLEVVVADAPIEDLEIRMPSASRIRGHILGLEPWESALVYLRALSASNSAQADKDGSYRSSDLRSGEWEVTASVASRLPGLMERSVKGHVTLRPGQEAVLDLDLHNGPWTLSGRTLKAGEPIAASVNVTSEDSSLVYTLEFNEDGVFRLPGLRPGIYRLQVSDPESGENQERIFEISSDLYLTFELPETVPSQPEPGGAR